VRCTVRRWTGIPVSVGIAPTKTLAKVANRRAKRDPGCEGVYLLEDEAAIDAELASMELTDLWGVAGRLAARLTKLGIANPLELKRTDTRFIRERFNVVLERLVLELRGIPYTALEEIAPDRKSIMASRSFGRPVETRHELEEAIATFTARAAEKMRRQALAVTRLMVFVHTNRFRPDDAQYYAARPITLSMGSADSGRLIRAALQALGQIYRPGFRYKKAGVVFLDLIPAVTAPGALFAAPDTAASKARMRAVDSLNRRFGRDTVSYAASGIRRGWKLRNAFLSPRYTTSWDELLQV